MGKRQSSLKNLEKAHQSDRIGKRGKSWKTIAQEKVRQEYEEELKEEFGDIFRVHIKAAKEKKNSQERMYAISQLVGKPKERVELDDGPERVKLNVGIQSTIDKIYGDSSKTSS